MKRTYSHSSHYCPAYPNEANANYYKEKVISIVEGFASGIFLTVSVIFLMMLM